MLDHKLTIFYHTAKYLSTTKAAERLRLSQPAISKSIKELEKELEVTLFEREKGRFVLTAAGKYLLDKSEDLLEQERKIEFDLQRMKNKFAGSLSIGASTTLSQYILPEMLAHFRRHFPTTNLKLISGNTQQIEEEIMNRNLQLAFIEGTPSQPDIHYIPFLQDEIVLVTSNQTSCQETLNKEELLQLKFVFRETGSGTYHIIQRQLAENGIDIHDLHQEMVIGTTEGIKQYLKHSDSFALVSIFSVREELANEKLKLIEISDMEISRTLYAIHKQGYIDSYAEQFLHFCENRQKKTRHKTK